MIDRSACSRSIIIVMLVLSIGFANEGNTGHQRPAVDEAQRLADQINELLAARWPADDELGGWATDAEFMRRVWLDVAGKIPSVADARDFLDDESPDKRSRLVDQLLNGPNYVVNSANFWRAVMMPEAESNFNVRFMLPGFDGWLRQRFEEDVRYDELVREILTTPVSGVSVYQSQGNPTPIAFYEAKETKPENLAAATSRMFLGVRLECAQCHDHPFDNWTQKDFWGYATFFAAMQRRPAQNGLLGQLQELFARRTLTIPETTQVVQARHLDGASPRIPSGSSARIALADWVTSADNPFFSRAAVNRVWGHFFGVGIVDPVDDFSDNNPASHPELLELLATEFANHRFDLKFLVRAITRSDAYQRTSSAGSPAHASESHPFLRMPVKGLTAEQLYDSITQSIGVHEAFDASRRARFARGAREQFLDQFTDVGSGPTERQRTVLQALAFMNGQLVADATTLESSMTLTAIAEYPRFDTADRIESLFLATLSRRPSDEELQRFVEYADSGETDSDPQRGLSDVFWVLLNSNEYSVNH